MIALWDSAGAYTFNLTRTIADALPLGYELTIIKLSRANPVKLNYGSSSAAVQMYRLKDDAMAKYGTFTLPASGWMKYIKITKLGGADTSFLMESNVSFS